MTFHASRLPSGEVHLSAIASAETLPEGVTHAVLICAPLAVQAMAAPSAPGTPPPFEEWYEEYAGCFFAAGARTAKTVYDSLTQPRP